VLEVQNLTISYRLPDGSELKALDRISFAISAGESVAIAGESGSGKSTLAMAIMGLLPANAIVRGAIRYRGQDLLALPESAMQQLRGCRISLIFQQPQMALHPLMRAERQVAEVIRAHHRWARPHCSRQARAVLEQVFYSDSDRICQRYPHELSGGECQRICIAQAIACRPELLIADEPTAMLDAVVQADVLRIFHDLCGRFNLTLMLITHNLALLPGLAGRTVVLEHSGD
jgi:ABC-type glutathione transport system ATPase component